MKSGIWLKIWGIIRGQGFSWKTLVGLQSPVAFERSLHHMPKPVQAGSRVSGPT